VTFLDPWVCHRPLVLVWDNLNVHLVDELADFFEENKAWLRDFQLPGYAPELNPKRARE
jgi:transposase